MANSSSLAAISRACVAQPPPSLFGVIRGHHQDNNPQLLPDMRYQIRIRFYKACSHNKMTHLEPLEIDRYPILRRIEGGGIICNRPILFNSQRITLRKLLNNDISFRWQLCGVMRSHTKIINACMWISFISRIWIDMERVMISQVAYWVLCMCLCMYKLEERQRVPTWLHMYGYWNLSRVSKYELSLRKVYVCFLSTDLTGFTISFVGHALHCCTRVLWGNCWRCSVLMW